MANSAPTEMDEDGDEPCYGQFWIGLDPDTSVSDLSELRDRVDSAPGVRESHYRSSDELRQSDVQRFSYDERTALFLGQLPYRGLLYGQMSELSPGGLEDSVAALESATDETPGAALLFDRSCERVVENRIVQPVLGGRDAVCNNLYIETEPSIGDSVTDDIVDLVESAVPVVALEVVSSDERADELRQREPADPNVVGVNPRPVDIENVGGMLRLQLADDIADLEIGFLPASGTLAKPGGLWANVEAHPSVGRFFSVPGCGLELTETVDEGSGETIVDWP